MSTLKTGRAPSISYERWEMHRTILTELSHTLSLEGIQTHMKEQHNFSASVPQYRRRLKSWNLGGSKARSKYGKRIPPEVWLSHQDVLLELYLDDQMTTEQIRDYMTKHHGLTANVQQLQRKLEKWGYVKKTKQQYWVTLCKELTRRKLDVNSVEITFRGELVEAKRVSKEVKRYAPPLAALLHDKYNSFELLVERIMAKMFLSLRFCGYVLHSKVADRHPLVPLLGKILPEDLRFLWPETRSQDMYDDTMWTIHLPGGGYPDLPAEGNRAFVSKNLLALETDASRRLEGFQPTSSASPSDRRRCTTLLRILCLILESGNPELQRAMRYTLEGVDLEELRLAMLQTSTQDITFDCLMSEFLSFALAAADFFLCKGLVGEYVDPNAIIRVYPHGAMKPLECAIEQVIELTLVQEGTITLFDLSYHRRNAMRQFRLLLNAGADPNCCAEHPFGCRPWSCPRNPLSRASRITSPSDIATTLLEAGAIDNPLAENLGLMRCKNPLAGKLDLTGST